MIDPGKAEVGERQVLERIEPILDGHVTPGDALQQLRKATFVGVRWCGRRRDATASDRQPEGPPHRRPRKWRATSP
jgi:hypothetical protein